MRVHVACLGKEDTVPAIAVNGDDPDGDCNSLRKGLTNPPTCKEVFQ